MSHRNVSLIHFFRFPANKEGTIFHFIDTIDFFLDRGTHTPASGCLER